MPTSSGIDTLCAFCGKPIVGGAHVIGAGGAYHLECTRGPDWKPETFAPVSPEFNSMQPQPGAELEYIVAEHYASHLFSGEVKKLLKAGWRLQGGVSVAIRTSGDPWFAQAMVREKAEVL